MNASIYQNDSCHTQYSEPVPSQDTYIQNEGYYNYSNQSFVCACPMYISGSVLHGYYNAAKGPACGTSFALGIKASYINDALKVFPNPASNSLQVTFSGSSGKASMSIYDMNGKLLLSQITLPTPNPSGEGNSATIDVSSLNEGVYTLSIITNEGVLNKKLVIVR